MVPAQLLDLTDWKLDVPVDSHGGFTPHAAVQVFQPALADYTLPPYFEVDQPSRSVVFRAPVEAATTSGSAYPRCELREMHAGSEAAWSNSSGHHELDARLAVVRLPARKPQLACAQVHATAGGLLELVADGTRCAPGTAALCVSWQGHKQPPFDRAYQLGRPFALKIAASGQGFRLYRDGVLVWEIVAVPTDGCYFKAGAYVLSNLSSDAAGEYGAARISALTVHHS